MNLVVQGRDVATPDLQALARLTGASSIEQIAPAAFRLLGADAHADLSGFCLSRELDFGYVPEGRRLGDFGLFVTDMDSTLITIECIDEIADMHGVKEQVAAITEAAMRGEMDFRASLRERVGLLAGLEASALQRVMDERLRLSEGAERLLGGLKAAGLRTVLVSGGFTFFTDRLKAQLGFDEAYANELEVVGGRLTGRLIGPILDGEAKWQHLNRCRDLAGLNPEQTIAVGDGANDLKMLQAAGVGIAFRAKPIVQQKVPYALNYVGLDGILNLFEIP